MAIKLMQPFWRKPLILRPPSLMRSSLHRMAGGSPYAQLFGILRVAMLVGLGADRLSVEASRLAPERSP